MRALAALLAMLVATAAHAGGSFILLGKKRPPIDPEDVVIYFDAPARYEKVAVVEGDSMGAFAFSSQGKTDKALQRMKKQAAKLGANAIILQGQSQRDSGAIIVPSGNSAVAISGGMIKSTSGLAIWEDRSAKPEMAADEQKTAEPARSEQPQE
jgi:hypothetical protein